MVIIVMSVRLIAFLTDLWTSSKTVYLEKLWICGVVDPKYTAMQYYMYIYPKNNAQLPLLGYLPSSTYIYLALAKHQINHNWAGIIYFSSRFDIGNSWKVR